MTPNSHIHVFIGYDEKQPIAWECCAESLREQASGPVSIYKLDHRMLRKLGLFTREWITKGDTGLMEDLGDSRPFSTQFAHSRFLVPALCEHLGISRGDMVIFVDSDFIFLEDPYLLLSEILQDIEITRRSYPVYCVKHDYTPKTTKKMNDQIQVAYNKKLWSSLMVFNLAYPGRLITKEQANEMTGKDLHAFEWLPKDGQGEPYIGAIHEKWNFIPDHSEERVSPEIISAIHWTEGLPDMPGYEYTRYAAVWNAYKRKVYEIQLDRGFYD